MSIEWDNPGIVALVSVAGVACKLHRAETDVVAALGALEGRIKAEIASLQGNVDAQVSAVQQRVTAVEQRVGRLEAAVGTAASRPSPTPGPLVVSSAGLSAQPLVAAV